MTRPAMTNPNLEDVVADDAYVEQLRAGATPDDELGQMAAAWRDEAQDGT
jgi:hypothetical protein